MKEIRILRLTLDNFKGQRHLSLELDGRSCTIFGENAAGKTTIYDGLLWLLFGKDSAGQSDFDIKPLDENGKVRDHQAISAVEAVLDVDGAQTALRRTYYEKWSAKRGSAAKTMDGHSSDFFVDGVPVKKNEFRRRVDELVGEERFRTLTSLWWFCRDLDWKSRRAVLFELVRTEEDRALLAREERFAPLLEAMGPLEFEAFRKKLQAERKGLAADRDHIPVRLDECRKTVEELEGVDFDGLRRERDILNARRDALSADLAKLEQNTLADSRRNDRDRLANELAALEQANAAHRREQEAPGPDTAGLARQAASAERELKNLKQAAEDCREVVQRCGEEVEQCRARWNEASGRKFRGSDCPTCGRPLDGALLEEAAGKFRAERKAAMDQAVEDSRLWKTRGAQRAERLEALEREIGQAERRLAEAKAELEQARAFRAPVVEDLPEYADRRDRLREQLAEAERLLAAHAADGAAVRAELNGKLRALEQEIDGLSGACAKAELLAYSRERAEVLRTQAAETAERLERLDGLAFLCEEFVRYKAGQAEEAVNRKFGLVRWKLFEEQVNGGLAECCEATVGGVPYGSLNNGAMVNAGIDAIRTLSGHYGVRVPLVVDNAESVTDLLAPDGQLICMKVSESDKELRVTYES